MKPLTPGQFRARERIAASPVAAAAPGDAPLPWRDHFARRLPIFDRSLTVDLGCAGGELLAAMAERSPASAFVGIDWKYADAARAAQRLEAAGVENAFVVRAAADAWPSLFAPGELDAILLFHPEPNVEPERGRHRLFAEPFLLEAAKSLRVGGRLILKTDHVGAFSMALATVGEAEPDWPSASPRHRRRELAVDRPAASEAARRAFTTVCKSFDLHADAATLAATSGLPFAGLLTPYEARFAARRRPIFYLELARAAGAVHA